MKKSFLYALFKIIAFTILISHNVMAKVTEVVASVDKNPAMADESITLNVVANGDVDRDAFDSSSLLKDFIVGRTSISSQTQMVNFSTTRTMTWSTTLIPRSEGKFTIPSFNIAGIETQPIIMTILPVSSNQKAQGRDLFITTAVDNEQVYLQQQIKYTVKLHLAVDLQRGSLEAPKLSDAEVRQIGKDAEYNEIINGKRYRIIERTFALTPQKSGKFSINGPLFQGEVIDNSRQSFGFFNRTKTINRVGPGIEIDVLPIPSGTHGHWLPSEHVQINEEWQPESGDFKVGEPITRTLTLTAVGLVEEQLPEIASQYPIAVKTYPDQATTATVERDNILIAQRVENIAIIPGQAGDIRIPEVKVPWFNILTKQTEYAVLPARTLTIAPPVSDASASLTPTLSQPLPSSNEITELEQSDVIIQPEKIVSWWATSSWVFLGLWLATLFGWIFHALRNNKKQTPTAMQDQTGSGWNELDQALKTQDTRKIFAPLTHWLAWYTGNHSNALPTSQTVLNDTVLNKAISDMFAQQYSNVSSNWDSSTLRKELVRLKQSKRNDRTKGMELKSLYPGTNNL